MVSLVIGLQAALIFAQVNVIDRAPPVERPTIDFDIFYLETLSYGTWSANETHRYVFQPKNTGPNWRPYREGRWIYTDHGWTWRGKEPWSWATDHYGFWTRRGVSGWAWVPGIYWLPATVEWIQAGDYVGWRASVLDRFSNMEESESVRYAHPAEWNFIPKSKLGQPLTAADYVSDDQAAELLAAHQPCDHVFVAWREIPRPGPGPTIDDPDTGERLPIPVVQNLTNPNQNAKDTPEAVFYYRPKFYQDEDGILRRIETLRTAASRAPSVAARQQIEEAVKQSSPAPRLTREQREAQWKKMERAHERELERWEWLRR